MKMDFQKIGFLVNKDRKIIDFDNITNFVQITS